MIYAEAAYFDGHPCKHVADWQEQQRRERIRRQYQQALSRKTHNDRSK